MVVPEDNLDDLFSGLIKYGNNSITCSRFLSVQDCNPTVTLLPKENVYLLALKLTKQKYPSPG